MSVAETVRDADDRIVADFDEFVNMGPRALEDWLSTPQSREVGYAPGGEGESVGHAWGRHIVKILHKKKSEYTGADIVHMHKVVGYIKRHLAERPKGDTSTTRWAYSLKNWGHDPART